MVTPPSKAIDRYIDGLPLKVQTNILSNAPETVEKAIQIAASITDALVKGGKLTRTGGGKKPEKKVEKTEDKKKKSVEEAEPSSDEKPARKKQKLNQSKNFAVTETAKQNLPVVNRNPNPQNQNIANPRKNYTGPHPLCGTCNFHHAAHLACYLCTNCNRYGHLANICRIQNVAQPRANQPHQPYRQNFQQPANAALMPRNGCYDCGNPGHFARDCPNRGARPQQAQIQAPANQGAQNA